MTPQQYYDFLCACHKDEEAIAKELENDSF